MTTRPPIAPADPAAPACPAEAPCGAPPEGPERGSPEAAPLPPDRCVPDEGGVEAPCPDDMPAPLAPDPGEEDGAG